MAAAHRLPIAIGDMYIDQEFLGLADGLSRVFLLDIYMEGID